VAFGGGLFLLYLGFSQVRSSWSNRLSLNFEKSNTLNELRRKIFPDPQTTKIYPVWAGILVSLSNPYWSVWWITIGLSYIAIALKQGFLGLVSFFSGHILSDFTWYCLIAGVVIKGQKFFPPRVYRGTMLICGLFLIGLGVYFIVGQASSLFETYFIFNLKK
jgi:threonine/homoserine/homoserine lactone efflux protein